MGLYCLSEITARSFLQRNTIIRLNRVRTSITLIGSANVVLRIIERLQLSKQSKYKSLTQERIKIKIRARGRL
jgi:hypothetical protein